MGNGHPLEKRLRCERKFVNDGLSLLQIEKEEHVSRKTLGTWRVKYEWDKKRSDFVSQPDEINVRLKRVLHNLLDEIDEILSVKKSIPKKSAGANGNSPKEEEEEIPFIGIGQKVAELDKVARTLARIDGMFYSKGVMLKFLDLFTEFAVDQGDAAFVKALHRLAPKFIDKVEADLA